MSTKMIPRALVVGVAIATLAAVASTPAGGSEPVAPSAQASQPAPVAAWDPAANHVAVVVDTGITVKTACVQFDEDHISGLEALTRAGMSPVTQGFGATGIAVCSLCETGCPSGPTCLTCGGSNFWGYSRAAAGATAFTTSPVGAGATVVRDGGVEGWRWSSGAPPAFVRFESICAAPPKVSVADISIVEGDSGDRALRFTLTLEHDPLGPASVAWATEDGTATVADGDYTAAGGTVQFDSTHLSATVDVAVHGDTAVEGDEAFALALSDPQRVQIERGRAIGTIVNDDRAGGDVVAVAGSGGWTPVSAAGAFTGGDVDVATDGFGVSSVTGGGGVSGSEVAFDVRRFWLFPVFFGSVRVDAMSMPVLFARVSRDPATATVTSSSVWPDTSRWPWRAARVTWSVRDIA